MTRVLESLQTAKLGSLLSKSHWNSTTTETKEDVFIRSPAASHTFFIVPNFHRDAGSRLNCQGNESIAGKSGSTSKIIDSDGRAQ